MKPTLNQSALNTVAKVLANQIKALEAQGYANLYFKAQFTSGGEKQNGIERGDVTKIAKQVRDYVKSEEADTVNVEIVDEDKGKSVYRRKFTGLFERDKSTETERREERRSEGLGAAEVNQLVAKGISESRREDEFNRLNVEVEELRQKTKDLQEEKDKLEASASAKKDMEFYITLLGSAFPGLAQLLTGTPLAQAAGFLAGTNDIAGNAIHEKASSNSEAQSLNEMMMEFCNGLTTQEVSSVHLMFMSFEKDKSLIPKALHFITTQNPVTTK